jgi:hypothetical protein
MLFTFLTRTIITALEKEHTEVIWGNESGTSYAKLTSTFSHLPFEMFKQLIESPSFEVPSDRVRY